MADTPDLNKLAKQYLDLWQQQLAGMAADSELNDTLARTMELMNSGAGSMAAMLQAASRTKTGEAGNDAGQGEHHTGAASATTASSDLQQRVDELTGRIAVLEQRLAALESNTTDSSAKPKPRSRKRKT